MRTLTEQELEERLLDYLYDELPADERVAFEASVVAYPALQAELEAHRRTRAAVSGLTPAPAPAGPGWDATLAAILVEAERASSPNGPERGGEVARLRPAAGTEARRPRALFGWLAAAGVVVAGGAAVVASGDAEVREVARVASAPIAAPIVVASSPAPATAMAPAVVAALEEEVPALTPTAAGGLAEVAATGAPELAQVARAEVAPEVAPKVAQRASAARGGGAPRASEGRAGLVQGEAVASLASEVSSASQDGFAPPPPAAAAAPDAERVAMADFEEGSPGGRALAPAATAPAPAKLAKVAAKDGGRVEALWGAFSMALARGDVAGAERTLAALEAVDADPGQLRRARAQVGALNASRAHPQRRESEPPAPTAK